MSTCKKDKQSFHSNFIPPYFRFISKNNFHSCQVSRDFHLFSSFSKKRHGKTRHVMESHGITRHSHGKVRTKGGGVTLEQTILYIDRNIFTGLLNLIGVRLESNPISVLQSFYVKRLCAKNRIYLLKFLFLRIKSLIFNIVTI
jgi:hypothetical protein